jgi:hypothetical protein
LHFVLATENEEIVAISWNPAEEKVTIINSLVASSLTITVAHTITILIVCFAYRAS